MKATLRRGLVIFAGLALGFGVWWSWEQNQPVRFLAAGDILPDRGVRAAIEQYGADGLFEGVTGTFRSGDLVLANLEAPLTNRSIPLAKRIAFRGDSSFAPALRRSGIDMVSLANNHTLDCGREGLEETIEAIQDAGIRFVGAGRNEREAHRMRVVTRHGLRIALLGYSTFPLEGLVYQPDRPTVSLGRDPGRVAREVRQARRKADLVIVMYHWGDEFTPKPTRLQRQLARNAIDAGADLVLGSHPHVLQPMETYRGRPIVYSLGNFVFDHKGEAQRTSTIFSCELTRAGAGKIRMIPVRIQDCRPQLAKEHPRR
ncbi:MAG: CapA family protein [Solirubrobacterales bacterium]